MTHSSKIWTEEVLPFIFLSYVHSNIKNYRSLDKIILPITDEMENNNRERVLPFDNDDDDVYV